MLEWNLLRMRFCLDKKALEIFESLASYLEKLPRNSFDEMLYYVGLCEYYGHCHDGNSRRLCADRWLSGKRKISAPGTKRKKREAKERAKLLSSLSEEFKSIIDKVINSDLASQYRNGNKKALNSCVGAILKQTKELPAQAVKELLERRLND